MELVSRLKRGGEYTQYFARGLAMEQSATTLGPLIPYLARKSNPDFGRPASSSWEDRNYARRIEAEGQGFKAGGWMDLALLATAFTPIAADNPRAAKFAAVVLGIKAVGVLASIVHVAIDERVRRYRPENTR